MNGTRIMNCMHVRNRIYNTGRIHATTIIVSHDRDRAFGIASRIAMLEDGRIIAIGTPDEIKRSADPRVQRFFNASISRDFSASARLQTPVPIPVWYPVNATP